jgi:drug/metabolite transporter (DMT)-like permease
LVNARALKTARWVSRGALPWIALAGLTLGGGAAFYYTALNYVDFSVAAPVVGAVPLVSYGFILLLLRGHERITLRVLIGAVMVVSGVIVIRIVNA